MDKKLKFLKILEIGIIFLGLYTLGRTIIALVSSYFILKANKDGHGLLKIWIAPLIQYWILIFLNLGYIIINNTEENKLRDRGFRRDS